ncbi:EpsG family protein [Erysipelothrix rhusiopathiae]|nr:EpsG family protein [Erysipelothrix rhusiopathiae]
MYYSIFIYLFILSCFEIYQKKLGNRIETKKKIIFIIPVVLVLALKYGQGADYVVYEYFYENPNMINNMDIFYNLIAKTSYNLGINFFVFYSLVTVFLCAALIYLLLDYTELFFFPFFYFFGRYLVYFHTTIRQGLAIVFYLFVLFEIVVKNSRSSNKKAIFFSLLSVLFHSSSLPFVLLLNGYNLFVKNNKFKAYYKRISKYLIELDCLYVILVSFVLYITLSKILPFFLLFLNRDFINHRLQFYLNPTSLTSFMYRVIEYYLINIIIKGNIGDNNSIFSKTKFITTVSLLFYGMLGFSSLISTRMIIYIDILKVFLIPQVIISKIVNLQIGLDITRLKSKITYAIAFIILFIAIDYIKFMRTENNFGNYYNKNYYPYVSIFNKDKIVEYSDYYKILSE